MYRVISNFIDAHDEGYSYTVGDVYPRDGYKASKDRISELFGDNNRCGHPFIERVKEDVSEGLEHDGTDVGAGS